MVKTFLPMRMMQPKVRYEYNSGVHTINLEQDLRCTIVLVGAGGFSFALYSGDFSSSGKPGWCGKQAVTGGCGAIINLKTVLSKGLYRVEIGNLGGGTDKSLTTYTKLKKPSVAAGSAITATSLYKDGELLLRAEGGGQYSWKYVGNQKNDGYCYVATGSANGGGYFINDSLAIIEGSVANGADGSIKTSSWSVTNRPPYGFRGWGRPNAVSAAYNNHYCIGYTVSEGTGGYLLILGETMDKEHDKDEPKPYIFMNSKSSYSIIRS